MNYQSNCVPKDRSIRFGGVFIAIGAFAVSVPAFAQDTAKAPAAEEATGRTSDGDIIVTALKNNATIQDAPVTINVSTGEKLEERGVSSIEQLTAGLPGVRIQQAPQGSIATSVRGLASSPSSNTFDQTVGFFIDGVYAGHGREYSSALFDVNRVELLKGTQGALVGKGTSMGAIALVTNKPEFRTGGMLSAYHEFELGTTTVNGVLNLGLSDTVAVRIAGITSNEGGWIENALDPSGDGPSVKRDAIRFGIRFAPDDKLDWTVYAQYSKQVVRGQYFRTGIDSSGRARTVAAFRGVTNFRTEPYLNYLSPRSGDANNPALAFGTFTLPGQINKMWRLTSNLSYDFGPVTLTSTTGYTHYTDDNAIEALGLSQMSRASGWFEDNDQFNQELRFSTNGDGPFSAVAGAYYWHDNWSNDSFTDQTISATTGGTGNAVGAFSRPYEQRSRSINGFGQITYKPIEDLVLTGGVRYEHYKKTGIYDGVVIRRLPTGSTLLANGDLPFTPFTRKASDNYFDYSMQAQYFLGDVQLYASWATGSKGFGLQRNPTSGVPGNPSFIADPYFAPELSKTLEVGGKWSLSGRGYFNLAFFNTKIKDFQTSFRRPDTVVVVRNDQIRSRGVEVGAEYELFDGFRAGVTATYADVKKTVPVAGSIDSLILAPKWSGIGTLSYDTDLTGELALRTNATFEFRSKQFINDSTTAVLPSDPGRVRTDIRIAVEHQPTQVELAVLVRNLFNVHGISYSYASPIGGAVVADEMPRQIGIQARVKF